MKFIVSSSTLLRQLNALNGVIVSNPIVPILENFLFEIKDNVLSVTASDLQTSITADLKIDSDEDASIAIPAKILSETLRNLPEQPVTFKVDMETYAIEIISDNGHYKLAGENAADFPRVPEAKNVETVEITSELISTAIAYTLYAVSTDEMKPAMNGVYVNLEGTTATFVATDSHRLVRYRRLDVATSATSAASMILPKKALTLLKNTLPSDDTALNLSFNKSNAFISFGNVKMVCRLIDERFPDYEAVIPLNNSNTLNMERLELLSSLKRISIYANKSTNQIRLKLGDKDTLHIFAEDIDFSNEADEMLMGAYEGDEIEIGFNARFLMDALGNVNSKRINFKFSEPNRAGLMMPAENDSNEDLLLLIMPVMLHKYY